MAAFVIWSTLWCDEADFDKKIARVKHHGAARPGRKRERRVSVYEEAPGFCLGPRVQDDSMAPPHPCGSDTASAKSGFPTCSGAI